MNSQKDKYKVEQINNKLLCNKWDYVFQSIYIKYIAYNQANGLKYLDVGCGSGNKTLKFAFSFNINKENIYGTDIKDWGPYVQTQLKHNFNFKYILDDGKLDFEDNTFDIVSCFFVLHHIKNLDNTMKELNRIVKPNGHILFMDHNNLTDFDNMIVDIEHLLYAIFYDKNDKYIKSPIYAKYRNNIEWDYIFNKYNFKKITMDYVYFNMNNEIKYDNAYYALYKRL